MSARLDHTTLLGVHAAAIEARCERDALLAGLPPALVASLPRASSPGAQLLQDLTELNAVGALAGGEVPLLTWLRNAEAMSRSQPQQLVFEQARRSLTPASPPSALPDRSDAGVAREGEVLVYISYALPDERFRKGLSDHLSTLTRTGAIRLSHRGQIDPGEDQDRWARRSLDEADMVLLLLSSDFINENVTYQEMERAMALRAEKGTVVVPILVRPVDLEGTPVAPLKALPASGIPLNRSTDRDAGLTDIAKDLRAMVGGLRTRSVATAAAPRVEPSAPGRRPPVETPAGARVGVPIDVIFVRNGVPDATYVEHEQSSRIRAALANLGRGLVIEGPTQIGKTTAITKLLGRTPPRLLDMFDEAAWQALLAVVQGGALEGHLVLDNVHCLHDDALLKVARFVRVLADRNPRVGKATLVGVANVAQRLAKLQPDLPGRMDLVPLNRQPDEYVRSLVTQGETAANVLFDHKEQIVRAARGSFRLAQELCFQCCSVAEIADVGPGAPRRVSIAPDDPRVIDAVRAMLDLEFLDPVTRFAGADGDLGAPGACLSLLWLLTLDAATCVLIPEAAARYPQLDDAFRWVRDGSLAAWLGREANRSVAALLTLSANEVRAPDPRFVYYLGVLDWRQLGRRVGLTVLVPSETLGDLQIVQAARAGAHAAAGPPSAAKIARGSILDAPPPFPWWHPSAPTLLRLLESAYGTMEGARMVAAQTPGLHPGSLILTQGIERFWQTLLDAAAAQGKLRVLLDVVFADENVAAYHESIRKATEPPR